MTIQILLLIVRMLTVYFHNNMIINKLFNLYVGCLFLSGTRFGKNKLKFLQIMQLYYGVENFGTLDYIMFEITSL